MNRYEKGTIYKICDIGYNMTYIGSTCQPLSKRFSKHKDKYNAFKNNKQDCNRRVNMIFDKYGVENCKIELVEDYPCKSKAELLKQEGHHIKTTDCVNKIISGRTPKEYAEEHQEQIKTRGAEYRDENREYFAFKQQIYRDLNPGKIKEYGKKYYQDKKEILFQKHLCECGKYYTYQHKKRHEKSQYHRDNIKKTID